MPKPLDRVQLIKRESSAGGGDPADADDFYLEVPLDPGEDAPEVQGLFFQTVSGTEDESVYITRDGNDMVFIDVTVSGTHGEVTLTDLLATTSGGGGTDELVKVSANDTLASYLISKIVAGDSIILTEQNDGSNETLRISTDVSEVSSIDYISSTVFAYTTSTSPQDAFLGSSLSPPVDGDYIVVFEANVRVTNNNGRMAISLGKNSTSTEESGSVRVFQGNKRGSAVVIFPFTGLITTDTIHGLFRKHGGFGTALIKNRAMFLMRVG